MKRIDKRLLETSKLIDKHLNAISKDNRAEESTEILSYLRDYCELVLYKIYDEEKGEDLYQTQENLTKVRTYIKTNNPKFHRIHQLLDSSSGHVTFGPEQSEALMIKYIPMLISMKLCLKQNYNFETLLSIEKYPLNLDDSLIKFYRKILCAIEISKSDASSKTKDLYFIKKKTMKYVDGIVFYEYVLDVSDDKPSKFNTIVAYSLLNIDFNYDMVFYMVRRIILFMNTKIWINIINDFEISIRPCAFKNLARLININMDIKSRSKSYLDLMNYIKKNEVTLLDIVENESIFTNKKDVYNEFIYKIHSFLQSKSLGEKLIKFLLLNMKNNVVSGQINKKLYDRATKNPHFNNFTISSGSLAFEKNPIAFSPKIETPAVYDLVQIINLKDYDYEILYKRIEAYIVKNNSLFVTPAQLGYKEENFMELVEKFNKNLYSFYSDHKIIKIYDSYTIKFYYEATIFVLEKISKLSNHQYHSVNLPTSENDKLSEDKNNILKNAFNNSSICIVTGAAGTGKTTLIHEFLKLNNDKAILCLTTTNTAKNNLRIDSNNNIDYLNITEYEKNKKSFYDFIIIDEASFVSTKSMKNIFINNPVSSYLIVGDEMQIESIEFGNWFIMALSLFAKSNFIHKLNSEHRAQSSELLKIWNAVRNKNSDTDKLLELISVFNFAEILSDDVFKVKKNQVVLCLNYDGLYGINNMNRYLQSSNPNNEFIYQQNVYKINDPVVFIVNDCDKFGIYNNLKGKIVDIQSNEREVKFFIKIEEQLSYFGFINDEISVENSADKTIIIVKKKFSNIEDYDNELSSRTKLPFQIAYAMSIHKAQGLEFESVRIVITRDTEEYISKNIFYTAITRAKKELEIFWDPEVPNVIFKNINEENVASLVDVKVFKKLIGEKKISL